jgi:hypothetical protein
MMDTGVVKPISLGLGVPAGIGVNTPVEASTE